MHRQFGSSGRNKSPRKDNDMLSPSGASYFASPSSHGFSSANIFPSNSSEYTSRGQEQVPSAPPPYSEISRDAPMTPATKVTPTPSTQNIDSDDSKFSWLGKFDTIFLVDDSGSMIGERWRQTGAAISAIAPICTKYDPDGIDIYFLNHRNWSHPSSGYLNVKSASDVEKIFSSVQPGGGTFVGERLRNILFPYLERVKTMTQAEKDSFGNLKDPSLDVRPIVIISITDGDFKDDVTTVVKNAAMDLGEYKAKGNQVGIQFVQVGNDSSARRALKALDDELAKTPKGEKKIRDIVDTVPWKQSSKEHFNGDYLLKIVLGAVNKSLDNQEVGRQKGRLLSRVFGLA
ncbi:uncharacterized protein TRUGW13939_09202 [Talaromyces rugulosus]|uniref:VWFA domain-containing protein n=1 Tax=Talaromyces rugulosus TaxID=121627 RepID=A0A7H8R762_TALRU|nr:uncharacterized protein TRUGW13939_09202 [Talaromyces rugulosus]QKX62046.1 hypothetical protein TRUGW13939_09202 [Talaromyces rugulosus]